MCVVPRPKSQIISALFFKTYDFAVLKMGWEPAGSAAGVRQGGMPMHPGQAAREPVSGDHGARTNPPTLRTEGLGAARASVGGGLPPGTPTPGRGLAPPLEQGTRAAGLTILRRILTYARKALGWEERLEAIRDARRRPQIPGGRAAAPRGIKFPISEERREPICQPSTTHSRPPQSMPLPDFSHVPDRPVCLGSQGRNSGWTVLTPKLGRSLWAVISRLTRKMARDTP